jgi:N-methylhydantoinase B
MIDPITFEVLRHRLSTIVDEGAAVLRNVSGSPSVAQSNDCNVALLTADGEGVVIGRSISSHAISCIQTTKHILKEYRDNPGISPDDMFFSNHPYVGTPHQPCGVLVAPVYRDGQLVAWAGAGIHFGDVGGPVPGQVSVGARSIWSEAIPVPPIKLVERGTLRKDLEAEFLTRTRTRVQNAVDLKAMIGANNTIKNRVLELIRRYGVQTIIGALDQIIAVSEAKLRTILGEMPDGRWACTSYLDYYDDDRMKIYACRLTLSKAGQSLVFDFTGSSKQAPAVVNATYGATEGYLLRAMLGLFGFAVSHCPAAIQRVMQIRAEPGTIVHCAWPAGVCKGTTSVTQGIWQAATSCLSQMLLGSDTYRTRAMAVSRGHLLILDAMGQDQYGVPFVAVLQDTCQAAGSAAGVAGNGIDTGGIPEPEVSIPNVESHEFRYPILYLYRRQQPGSGGPGTFRGGVGLSMAVIPHDVPEISDMIIHSHGLTFPSALGLSGGYPAPLNRITIKRDTDVQALFRRGTMPTSLSQIEGREEVPPPFTHTSLKAGSVVECVGGGGGGFGDPLERDPEAVVRDVVNGLVSREAAREQYGVVIDDAGAPDGAATAQERANVKKQRVSLSRTLTPRPQPEGGTGKTLVGRINEYLAVIGGPEGPAIRCRCGHLLCSASENHKEHLAVRELSNRADFGEHEGSWSAPSFSVREFCCPRCWTLVETEVWVVQTEA